MGDNFLRQQGKNFRKRRDLASRELNLRTLFTRPDVMEQVFHGTPCGEKEYRPGERLYATPDPANETMTLMRDFQKVGVISGDGARVLLDACRHHKGLEMIPMDVTEVSEFSRVAQLRLSE